MGKDSGTLRASYACIQILSRTGITPPISPNRSVVGGVSLAESSVEEVSYGTTRLMQRPGEAKVHRVFAFK